jgi:hypothetical protein
MVAFMLQILNRFSPCINACAQVDCNDPSLQDAYVDVRNDKSDTDWYV